jgi:hypothetical protein
MIAAKLAFISFECGPLPKTPLIALKGVCQVAISEKLGIYLMTLLLDFIFCEGSFTRKKKTPRSFQPLASFGFSRIALLKSSLALDPCFGVQEIA